MQMIFSVDPAVLVALIVVVQLKGNFSLVVVMKWRTRRAP